MPCYVDTFANIMAKSGHEVDAVTAGAEVLGFGLSPDPALLLWLCEADHLATTLAAGNIDPARIWTREGAVRFLGEFAADWPLRDLAVAIVARGGAMPPPGVTVTPTPAGAARDAGFFDAVYLTTLTMTTAADLFPGRSIWALTPDELSRVSTHAGCLVGSVANSWTSGQPLVLVQPPSATTAAIADTTHPSGKPIGHYL